MVGREKELVGLSEENFVGGRKIGSLLGATGAGEGRKTAADSETMIFFGIRNST